MSGLSPFTSISPVAVGHDPFPPSAPARYILPNQALRKKRSNFGLLPLGPFGSQQSPGYVAGDL